MRRSAPGGGWPDMRAPPPAWSEPARGRSRSPAMSSDLPRRVTRPRSRCSPTRRPRSRAGPADGRALAHRGAGLTRGPEEVALLGPLAGALAGAGRFADARRALLELLASLPEDGPARTDLIVACAMMDRLLGDHDGARARLRDALAGAGGRDAVALNLELAAHASLRGDPLEMRACATEALAGAAEPVSVAAATAALAMAAYTLGEFDEARSRGGEATGLVAALSDEQLGARLDMLLYLGWSQFFLGAFAVALEHFARGTAIARRTGSAVLALELMVGEALGLLARGRIAQALDVADGAVEEARSLGSAQSLVWALYAQATVLEAGGDAAAGVAAGEEALALTAGLEPSSITAGVRLSAGGGARGHRRRAARDERPARAAGRPGPPRFFAGQRAGCYEVLVRAALLERRRRGRRELGRPRGSGRGPAARRRRGPARARARPADRRRRQGAAALALESVATCDALELAWNPRAAASSRGGRWPRRANETPPPSSCAPPKGCWSTPRAGTCAPRPCASCGASAGA